MKFVNADEKNIPNLLTRRPCKLMGSVSWSKDEYSRKGLKRKLLKRKLPAESSIYELMRQIPDLPRRF